MEHYWNARIRATTAKGYLVFRVPKMCLRGNKKRHNQHNPTMNCLPITSAGFEQLLCSYTTYMQTLGYAPATTTCWTRHLRELLYYLETLGITEIRQADNRHLQNFTSYIMNRSHSKIQSAGLSGSSINNTLCAVNLFIKYLCATGTHVLDILEHPEKDDTPERAILTETEIKQLYEATYAQQRCNTLAMGQRDRAIIAVFYGCGLRRTEGQQLNVSDIDLDKQLIFVRKGKCCKQRYVPIAGRHLQDIKDYLDYGRQWFLHSHGYNSSNYYYKKHGVPFALKKDIDNEAFFINMDGKRMGVFFHRIVQLKKRAGITKPVMLHSLRHSIATHLLYRGMDIEAISKLLGHASLDSTQIYTHIINEQYHEP